MVVVLILISCKICDISVVALTVHLGQTRATLGSVFSDSSCHEGYVHCHGLQACSERIRLVMCVSMHSVTSLRFARLFSGMIQSTVIFAGEDDREHGINVIGF